MTECNRKNRLLGKSIRKIRMRDLPTKQSCHASAHGGIGRSSWRRGNVENGHLLWCPFAYQDAIGRLI